MTCSLLLLTRSLTRIIALRTRASVLSCDRAPSGVQAAGMVGMRFNTIGVSDGISMGTSGMSYSLQSRDLIADSIETVSKSKSSQNLRISIEHLKPTIT